MNITHAISLTQPWATLMALDAKRIETRGWRTSFRGWLAIHAAKGFPKDCQALCSNTVFRETLWAGGLYKVQSLPLGAVIAVVNIVDCRHTEVLRERLAGTRELAFGDYSDGRYGFIVESVRQLREPIPMKGALSIWKMPRAITDADLI